MNVARLADAARSVGLPVIHVSSSWRPGPAASSDEWQNAALHYALTNISRVETVDPRPAAHPAVSSAEPASLTPITETPQP